MDKPPEVKPERVAVQRTAHALDLLVKGVRPSAVARAVAEHFGVAERTAWFDVKEAQEDLARSFERDMPVVKAKLWAYFNKLMGMAVDEGDIRGGVQAASALAKLCGADAPAKIEVTANSGVLQVRQPPKSTEEWLAAREAEKKPTP